MEKKELKFYEAPELEVLNMDVEGFFCESNPDDPFDDSKPETPVVE
ncbi:MAG: hypothetical protein IJV33_02645 [Bacteroidaceae bacterium]|nr:hypothetical protein [Bacteroidaceae bacterium]